MEEAAAAVVPAPGDLELATQKVEEGKKALEEKDYRLAQDAFAQALEIM